MIFATLYSYIRTYLSVRNALVNAEQKISSAKRYDKPCCDLEKSQKKGLFLLWCLENIDCYDENVDKLLSVANRWSKNCADCSVSQAEIDAFLGNLNTKIFHANGDKVTNQWAAETISRIQRYKAGFQTGNSEAKKDSSGSPTLSFNQSYNFEVDPIQFTLLPKGGPENELEVDAFIFQGGRVFNQFFETYLLPGF